MTEVFDFDDYSRKFKEDDFLRQTMRTIDGKPVPDEQLALVRSRIAEALSLEKGDYLLDLCCGNGHLAAPLFSAINQYMGVDASENLIQVANKYFAQAPRITFQEADAVKYILSIDSSEKITKMLWYGSCQYFQDDDIVTMLDKLFKECSHLARIFIGNLPDREQAHKVLSEDKCNDAFLDNNLSVFGKWRSRDDFNFLISKTGWRLDVWDNDDAYHGKHYRYDLLLTRDV